MTVNSKFRVILVVCMKKGDKETWKCFSVEKSYESQKIYCDLNSKFEQSRLCTNIHVTLITI